MAGEVVVDALPYIDQGYDEPGVREAVSTFFNSIYKNRVKNTFLLLKGFRYGRRRMQTLQTNQELPGAHTSSKHLGV